MLFFVMVFWVFGINVNIFVDVLKHVDGENHCFSLHVYNNLNCKQHKNFLGHYMNFNFNDVNNNMLMKLIYLHVLLFQAFTIYMT